MKNYKTISKFQSIKIKLLEDFILESARLADLYRWVIEPEEIIKLDKLSTQLDDITEQIENLQK